MRRTLYVIGVLVLGMAMSVTLTSCGDDEEPTMQQQQEQGNGDDNENNGNSIFLPAAGCRDYASTSHADKEGLYQSRTLDTNTSFPCNAHSLHFGSHISDINANGSGSRAVGQSVRPVRVSQ